MIIDTIRRHLCAVTITASLLLIIIQTSGFAYSENSEHFIPFDELHKFHPGDNPEWSLPEYDDSDWKRIAVPGGWQSQGVKPDHGTG